MRFTSLLAEAGLAPLACQGDAEVTSVSADSRRCDGQSCFVALRGGVLDGHEFIPAAIANGAPAIVCEKAINFPEGQAYAVVEDTHEALGRLAQASRGWPARKMTCIGITGTNGKSTVAHLTRAILAALGYNTAMIGTITYETGSRSIPAGKTTPDAVELADLMAEMVENDTTHLVMETSSHALDQRRTAGVDFDVAVFTNLSGDHLDYHHTMENYLAAKGRLFENLSPEATAVLNRDDSYADWFASITDASIRWYGLSPLADLRGRIETIDMDGTVFDLVASGGKWRIHTPLIGRHNVFNCLAAAGVCEALGVDPEAIARQLESVENVPGRLQRVPTLGGYDVFIDYAHTDDALTNVISSLRPITAGRVIVVFGCGGDRDKTKRPRMAKVAQDLADHIVVTSDNPRNEDPAAIIDDILVGFDSAGRAKTDVQPDRRRAIAHAIGLAREGDVVLIAGKGHENYQVVRQEKTHFDDAEVAAECIGRAEGAA
jgi:UDP-N-acetylmuramoyl-L-alanyl-D-glutamate--2,6-diaminopimelate ligase